MCKIICNDQWILCYLISSPIRWKQCPSNKFQMKHHGFGCPLKEHNTGYDQGDYLELEMFQVIIFSVNYDFQIYTIRTVTFCGSNGKKTLTSWWRGVMCLPQTKIITVPKLWEGYHWMSGFYLISMPKSDMVDFNFGHRMSLPQGSKITILLTRTT